MRLRFAFLFFAAVALLAGCDKDSVTAAEIEAIGPGSKVIYRFFEDGKRWYYLDKVTRIEGDTVYYLPSVHKSSSSSDGRLYDLNTSRELSMTRAELMKFQTSQEPNNKKIVRIE